MNGDLVSFIEEMLRSGYTEEDIINYLNQQGFQPKDILDALNKLKLRKEEAIPSIMEAPTPTTAVSAPPTATTPETFQSEVSEVPQPGVPRPQLIPQMPFIQEMPTTYAPTYNLEAFETLAEELIAEKFELMKRKVGDLEEIRKVLEDKIKNLEEKIKRVEYNLDNINLLILKRHEQQQKEIKMIGKEISMLEEAFSKVLKPLTENIKKLEEISKELRSGEKGKGSEKKK